MTTGKYLRVFVIYITIILMLPLLAALTVFLKVKKYLKNELKNKKNISGEVAVITGSARGLGRDIAIELAKRGCSIAVVDVRYELAQETAEYLTRIYGVKAKAYKVDVSDYQQLVELKHNVTKDLGHTTILVNNAAILILPLKPKPEHIQKMIDVNFTGAYFANQVFLPKMQELNRGYILTTSSLGALIISVEIPLYGACKMAVRSLASAMRVNEKNENRNITVTTVMPWFLNSNKLVEEILILGSLHKIFPLVESQSAAEIAVEAMLNGEEEITIPGFFFCFYKMLELFPAAVGDCFYKFVYNYLYQDKFQVIRSLEHLKKPEDTLKLFES